ncbi:MAG: tetratricopeptide repeat protein [Microcoleus vaginatus WJT46-NPBG5]|nr:tetratricopeptide repeat protein [Microcoleus vaginatus WJT46-NPBG5]
MHRHLHRLSVISATLLISLSFPLPVVRNTWGSGAALAQAQTRKERNEEALRLGIQQYQQGLFREALETFQSVLAIVREIGDRQGEGVTLNNIGFVHQSLGQYPKALESYQQALAIHQEIGNKAEKGTTLTNIGSVHHRLGQYPQALEYYQQALAIAKEIGDKAGEGTRLNNIGGVYSNLGQYPKALEFYQQALAIAKEIGDKAGEGTRLNNIGAVYNNLGQYPKALDYYQQALAIHQEIGNKAEKGTTLANIGSVYANLGQYPKALESYQQALTIAKDIGDKAGEGTRLHNIGSVYDNLGQYPKALESYQQALAIHQEIGDKAAEGVVLNNIGLVYDNLGQYPKALESYQPALAIAKEIGDKEGEGTTLSNIGGVYYTQGNYSQAETTLLAAIEAWESLRPRELKDDQKISIFEQQATTYRFLQQALVAQNKVEEALLIAERSRGRALVDLLDSKLSENHNNQPNLKLPNLPEIKQIASEQNATLVQYSIIYESDQNQVKEEWQQSKLYIWVIKPTGEIAYEQVDLKKLLNTSLQDLVTTSRDDIGVRSRSIFEVTSTNPQPESSTEKLQQLHQLLIAPIADLLPKNPDERVIFIPQESLFLVPFPALQDEQGKYLIEKHTILTAPAIQVLDLTHKQKHNTQRSVKDVLVVGNPTMPKIQIGELVANLNPLPGAEREAIQIAKLFNTEALIGSKATKTMVMEKMQRSRIIHLATHGLLDDFKGFGVPGAIALAPAGKPDDALDGLLTAGEIFDMKLQADLVVLSACDTGRGDIKGDGVVGLSRSLIAAGVPSVLVSLWAVNDNSTAFLMNEFYRSLQQNPNKAVALRQAMLTTMKEYPNPKQWAAFTLIGEAN